VAPSHRWADAKLWWRDKRMRLGVAPAGSSPREQEELGANEDAVWSPKTGEGEKLRK